MAVTNLESAAEVRAHRSTFVTFERLVLFAVMHIILTLACLALGLIGHLPAIALVLGVGGTLALIAGFVIAGANTEP
jgi:hypothetical protein